MMIELMHVNKDITLNTDICFASRIISKYSVTGKYFFQGISLTFLKMNTPQDTGEENQNDVYLSLKLLLAYNYQQLYKSISGSRNIYTQNLDRVLLNRMNLLKTDNEPGYEYIHNIYNLVTSKADVSTREKIQTLLSEKVKTFLHDSRNILTVEQDNLVKSISSFRETGNHKAAEHNTQSSSPAWNTDYTLSYNKTGNDNTARNNNILNSNIQNGNIRNNISGYNTPAGYGNDPGKPYTENIGVPDYNYNGSIGISPDGNETIGSIESINLVDRLNQNRNLHGNNDLSNIKIVETGETGNEKNTADGNPDYQNKINTDQSDFENKINISNSEYEKITDNSHTDITQTSSFISNLYLKSEDVQVTDKGAALQLRLPGGITDIPGIYHNRMNLQAVSHAILKNTGEIVSSPEDSRKADIYHESNVLINLLNRHEQNLTTEEKHAFYTMIRSLNISEEDKKAVIQGIEQNKSTLSRYDNAVDRLCETFTAEIEKEQYWNELKHSEIRTYDIEKFARYFSDRNEIVHWKEAVLEYAGRNGADIQGKITEILKTQISAAASSKKSIDINFALNHLSDRELVHFTQAFVKEYPKVLDEIWNRPSDGTEYGHPYRESDLKRSESEERIIGMIDGYRNLNNNTVITDTLIQEYFTDPDIQNLISMKMLNTGLNIYSREMVKEKLIRIVKAGTEIENNHILYTLQTVPSPSGITISGDGPDKAVQIYGEINGTTALVHMIKNAKAPELIRIIQTVYSDRHYGGGRKEALFIGQADSRSNTAVKPEKEAFIGDAKQKESLSSVRLYRRRLFEKNLQKEIKEELIKIIESSQQKQISAVAQLVENQFVKEDIIRLMSREITFPAASSKYGITKQDLIKIIKNTDEPELELLLQVIDNRNTDTGVNLTAILRKKLYRYEIFKNTQLKSDTFFEVENIKNRTSIEQNQRLLLRNNSILELKEKLVRMVAAGRQQDNAAVYHMIMSLYPEEVTSKEYEISKENKTSKKDEISKENETSKKEADYEDFLKGTPQYGIETKKLIYFIQKADQGTLENIIQTVRVNGVYEYGRTLDHILKDIITNRQRTSFELQTSRIVFESSIVNNKLYLEQKNRRSENTVKQKRETVTQDTQYEPADTLIFKDQISQQFERGMEIAGQEIPPADMRQLYRIPQNLQLPDLKQQASELTNAAEKDMSRQLVGRRDTNKFPVHETDLSERNIIHQDILKQNILMQKRLLKEYTDTTGFMQAQTAGQETMPEQSDDYATSGGQFRYRLDRSKDTSEAAVKKYVDDYMITERAQMNYSHQRNNDTLSELNDQKKEISKLKENLSFQNKAVEELKKQISTGRGNADNININKLSKEIIRKMQQQIMVARMRKGLD